MTTHSVDRLATRIWYQAVEDGLGLDNPYAVELYLEGERVKPDKDGIKRPRKWRNFSQGKRTPADNPGTLNVFDLAERHAPGTARWFRSPMWRALKGAIDSSAELRRLIAGAPALRRIVLSESDPVDFAIPAQGDIPPLEGSASFIAFEAERIPDCAALEGLDLLEAIILLLEYGHLARMPSVTVRALDLYTRVSPKICEITELRYTNTLFFDEVEWRYASDIDLPPEEIFPPWHVRMPELTEQIYDIPALRREALAWDGVHLEPKAGRQRDIAVGWSARTGPANEDQ